MTELPDTRGKECSYVPFFQVEIIRAAGTVNGVSEFGGLLDRYDV
jgi:hypothetical protein